MNRWKHTLHLEDVWTYRNGECGAERWTDKTVHELGKIIARRLEKKFQKELEEDFELEEIIYYFSTIATEKDYKAARAVDDHAVRPIEEFDEVMRGLYDWAEGNRVWIEK